MLTLFLPLTLLSSYTCAYAQEAPEAVRKVLTRVAPQYPNLARSLSIRGNVKVAVCIAANGSPKSIQVKGGNPVLAEAAEKALRDWKWEPAPHETWEVIDLKFDPR